MAKYIYILYIYIFCIYICIYIVYIYVYMYILLYIHFERLSEWVKTSNAFVPINQQDVVSSSEEGWLNSGFSGFLVECFEIIKEIWFLCQLKKGNNLVQGLLSSLSNLYPTTMCRALGYFSDFPCCFSGYDRVFRQISLWVRGVKPLTVVKPLPGVKPLHGVCRWFPGANGSQRVLLKFCHLQMTSLHCVHQNENRS